MEIGGGYLVGFTERRLVVEGLTPRISVLPDALKLPPPTKPLRIDSLQVTFTHPICTPAGVSASGPRRILQILVFFSSAVSSVSEVPASRMLATLGKRLNDPRIR